MRGTATTRARKEPKKHFMTHDLHLVVRVHLIKFTHMSTKTAAQTEATAHTLQFLSVSQLTQMPRLGPVLAPIRGWHGCSEYRNGLLGEKTPRVDLKMHSQATGRIKQMETTLQAERRHKVAGS